MDIGGFIDALEYASGAQAMIIGKPSPDFFQAALDDMGLKASDQSMVALFRPKWVLNSLPLLSNCALTLYIPCQSKEWGKYFGWKNFRIRRTPQAKHLKLVRSRVANAKVSA
jgi:hypothetical protein